MAEDIENFSYPFAYLFDEDQSVAHSYKAACTPDFFIFDSSFTVQYMGQYGLLDLAMKSKFLEMI